ncbi:LacI family DNA-binding transcriptional regulator [Treponema brennaborense]|uniref:Transcriptional regulator, LacI family n=1 Tax=Treponema brennaborense (strain DSM 12168 / CIP 105900 / DD5/3) TaxID=906968 RepID=F4LLB0_TREBD|nr:LacI family DNA-binding transcriptional regulator [Treponema brennaborense]AEE15588.1 transcriptional regulator, LacI family [Treponema brennaborense DSM 12168]
MFTIKDVASDAGVSTATVSRVLNHDSRVAGVTREKVITSIEKLGYRLHPAARSLKVGETRFVGIIVPEVSNIFFMSLFGYMEAVLRKEGYTAILCSSANSVAGEVEQLKYLTDKFVDGLIVIPAGNDGTHFSHLKECNIPIVMIDREYAEVAGDSVLVRNDEGTKEAVTALIGDGFDRIGFVGGDVNQMTSRERFEGYKQALAAAGVAFEPECVALSGMDVESGYSGMKELLSKPDHPQAFFFVNLMVALGAVQYLVEMPAAVQEKIVCASFDNVFYSSLMQHCRYFVAQPAKEMGTLAAQLLIARIQHKSSGSYQSIRLKTTLIKK